jgi:hypothetical protein
VSDLAITSADRRWQAITYWISAQRGILLAIAIFALMFGL